MGIAQVSDLKLQKATVFKVDESLGLVFGWGIICTEKGEDHFDLQGDHIPETVMVEATSDFMENARVAKDMHVADSEHGVIVHSFPLTKDIAEAMGIVTEKTGWMVAMKPSAEVLKKYADGTYTGFSVGGVCTYIAEAE
jgi:hypothetical protein